MELIKSVIEIWKTCLDLPYQHLLNTLQTPTKDTKTNLGIELIAILLANKITPWSEPRKEDFYKALVMNFNSSEILSYKPCSEVIGLILNLNPIASTENVLLDCVKRRLDYLQKNQEDVFITCLYGISKHYPDIADNYMTFVVYHVSRAVDSQKVMLLQILLARLEKKGAEYCHDIKKIDFDLLLRDRQVVNLALQIIHKIIPFLQNDINTTLLLIEYIKRLVNSEDKSCRKIVYDIAITSYQIVKSKTDWNNVLQHVQYILLLGLLDSNPELNDIILKFWQTESALPKTFEAVFRFVLSNLYDVNLEKNFLQYGITILLQMSLQTNDAKRKLFDHPLSECTFRTYK